MKNLLIYLSIVFFSLNLFSQETFNQPTNPEKNVGLFGGPYLQLNTFNYLEFGLLGGINFKDVVMVGPYYQKSIFNDDFYGLYSQINLWPKEYYFTVGLACRVGFVNNKYLGFEPAMTIQHNNMNDRFKIIHQIGFSGGPLPSYNIGILFGNFGMKYWKKP